MNVDNQPLVEPSKILLPSMHLKLGLMKNFVKAMNQEEPVLLLSLLLMLIKLFVVFLFNTSALRHSQAPAQRMNWKSCGRNRSHYSFE